MEKMILYQLPNCPFCMKVKAKLADLGLKEGSDFEVVNVARDRSDALRRELVDKSHVTTVPVMLIDEKYIGESSVIIEYLEAKFNKK